ncbi:MAG: geranylgeranylglycerol-phosphate geranylgeranyltransferase [Sulfolobales archaeon]
MTLTTRIKAVVIITRPHNVLITLLGVVLGALIAEQNAYRDPIWLLISSTPALMIAAGGYIVNDYYDIEIDRKSKPWRPLVRGDISPQTALQLSILLIVLGCVIAFLLLGFIIGVFASFNALITYLYSWRLKRLGLIGNIAVSLLSANSILYGGLIYMLRSGVIESLPLLLIPWSFAMVMSLSREIVKGIEDIEGDRAYGIRTIAVTRGYRFASIISTLLLAILLTIVGIPFIIKQSIVYIALATTSIAIFLASTIRIAASKNIGDAIKRASLSRSVSKLSLLLGTIAFITWALT